MSYSIRVVDDDGRPRSGIGVQVFYGLTHSGTTYTDDDGWVEFDDDPTFGEIYIDGESQGEHTLKGTLSFTV